MDLTTSLTMHTLEITVRVAPDGMGDRALLHVGLDGVIETRGPAAEIRKRVEL